LRVVGGLGLEAQQVGKELVVDEVDKIRPGGGLPAIQLAPKDYKSFNASLGIDGKNSDYAKSEAWQILCPSHKNLDAGRTAQAIRGHWGIENQAHWVLDVTFNEDQSRIRKGNGAENFPRLRRMALNKLRAYQDPSGKKHSLRMKRKKCGWSFDYFLKVMGG